MNDFYKNMEELCSIIGYNFNNTILLNEALTHPSYRTRRNQVNKNAVGAVAEHKPFNYERLEFLGDYVLGCVIAEYLILKHKAEQEGDIAKRHAAIVCGESCCKVAKNIGLGKYIVMSDGENSIGGRENKANLEDVAEALVGAIYFDGGIENAKKFIHKFWVPIAETMKEPPRDPKSLLQEWAQSQGKPIPEYNLVTSTGPDHAPIFNVEVKVKGALTQVGFGHSKKVAEKEAAVKMLQSLYIKVGNT